MPAGDLVRLGNGALNHILTGNPKSTVCGKFSNTGWSDPIPGADVCKKCAGLVQYDPQSREALHGRA